MSKLSAAQLKVMLAAEKSDALSAMTADKLSTERASAMSYYLGDVSKDIPAANGRSKAVSFDVADTIEGLMPPLMEVFAGGDEVVRFDPVGQEDEKAAEQETDFVNHVFMQKNPGFLVLYSFIKDALLSKVGVVKIWHEKKEISQRETYFDQPDDAFAILASNPNVEIVEHTEKPDPNYEEFGNAREQAPKIHDITLRIKKDYECDRVEGVPPEEFGIARNARAIKDTDYCFHEVTRSESVLIDQGFDEKQVKALPSYTSPQTGLGGIEGQARSTVDEWQRGNGDEGKNSANRQIRITEHYVRMDYEGDGKPGLYRVTTGGEDGVVLKRDGKDDIEPIDFIPFAAMTPIIITHRFFGRSVADLVMDIQRIKTVLLRGLLDNLYLHNNPRVEVAEAFASETTLDDLLVSRPGGIVRTKQPGGLAWQVVPNITGSIYPAMQYMDATREWRTGVSRQGQGVDPNSLQNQVATIANQMEAASRGKMILIARIFAETGIRDMFSLLHATIRKHNSKPAMVRLRNQWVDVDPRDWKERNDMTVNVGLGTGSKQEEVAKLMGLVSFQKEALMAGKTNLVSDVNLYNSAKEMVKLAGRKNVEEYFTDPSTQPPLQPQPDPKLIELQAKNEIEKTQAQADIATQQTKTQAEMALAERKAQIEEKALSMEMAMKQREHEWKMAEMTHKAMTAPAQLDGEGKPIPNQSGDHLLLLSEIAGHLRKLNAPKRVVRGADGRVSHVEPMAD